MSKRERAWESERASEWACGEKGEIKQRRRIQDRTNRCGKKWVGVSYHFAKTAFENFQKGNETKQYSFHVCVCVLARAHAHFWVGELFERCVCAQKDFLTIVCAQQNCLARLALALFTFGIFLGICIIHKYNWVTAFIWSVFNTICFFVLLWAQLGYYFCCCSYAVDVSFRVRFGFYVGNYERPVKMTNLCSLSPTHAHTYIHSYLFFLYCDSFFHSLSIVIAGIFFWRRRKIMKILRLHTNTSMIHVRNPIKYYFYYLTNKAHINTTTTRRERGKKIVKKNENE